MITIVHNSTMSDILPYSIGVPDAAIEKLQAKLRLATLPGETTFTNEWKYGAALDDIKRLVRFWQEKYDWRKTEIELNRLPQFTTSLDVGGHEDRLKIHFVHQKGARADSIPLLFCHRCMFSQRTVRNDG